MSDHGANSIGGYEEVLAEFLSDRGRWPQLGDVLERERRTDIEASYELASTQHDR